MSVRNRCPVCVGVHWVSDCPHCGRDEVEELRKENAKLKEELESVQAALMYCRETFGWHER